MHAHRTLLPCELGRPGSHRTAGLLTEDRSLYRPDSFMQTPILPVRDTALRLQEALMAKDGDDKLDCVLAMTHQVRVCGH